MSETPWVVFDGKKGVAVCLRCKETLNMPLPQPLRVFVAATEAFRKIHANCKETANNAGSAK